MCGFAGFLSFNSSALAAEERRRLLVAMGNAIAHRGPDDAQYYDDGTLSLVFRRLSIVDVAGGSQPIRNENGDLLIVANAEIYNHHDLRGQLEADHRFSSHSDCEVPLHAFEKWGDAAWERLDGMFAIAIWNRQSKTLSLARDRLGIKPLYICRLSTGILFGSELKALLAHPSCPRDVDWRAFSCPSLTQAETTTYLKGVEMLPGGQFMTVRADGVVHARSYWQITDRIGSAPFGSDAAAYKTRYADLLEQVTYRHLQRDVGAGLHLSGGLDSSLLAGIVARKEKNFACFTIVERATCLGGDVDSAQRLTQSLGLPWYPVRFDYRTLLDEMSFDLRRLEQSVWMMDSPRFDLEWLFKGELHRAAKAQTENLKVVLLGQGSDEFAGGYSTRMGGVRNNWSHYLHEEIAPNVSFDADLRRGVSEELRELMPYQGASHGEGADQYFQMMPLWVRQLQNHNLWHEDRSSSWHSLEARVPFLDHNLVELLVSVPTELHEGLFWNKEIVRAAARRFLPDHVFHQPKIGFLDSKDRRSVDLILHGIVKRSVAEFREKYVESPTFLFDRAKVTALIERVVVGSPSDGESIRRLIDCMSISIFERQCQQSHAGFSVNDRDAEPCLSIVQPAEWDLLNKAMAASPTSMIDWRLTDHVSLPEGAEVLAPLRSGDTQRYMIKVGNTVVSGIEVPLSEPWLGTFLKNLGTESTRNFTLQEWIDEFDLAPHDFFKAMTILYQGGAIVRAGHSLPALVQETDGRLRSDKTKLASGVGRVSANQNTFLSKV